MEYDGDNLLFDYSFIQYFPLMMLLLLLLFFDWSEVIVGDFIAVEIRCVSTTNLVPA